MKHYNLDTILVVGYRVRSLRGTQFRRWATERLSEYLVKGFTMDDQRLKTPPIFGMNAIYKPEAQASESPEVTRSRFGLV